MLCVSAATAAGQAGGTLVTTIVERETHAPLAYSTVTVTAVGRSDSVARFTDDAGQTLFAPLTPGRYRIRARELGFAPADTVVDLADSVPRWGIVLALHAIPHQLETVDVREQGVCRQPGIPDEIASQIHENAQRAQLLTAAYPFYYQREERIANATDTVTYDSRQHPTYRVGHMVRATRDRRGRETVVFVLPTLQDLADSGFQRVHCFWYAGRDSIGVRIDVEPLVSLGDVDIAARFYLDPERYLVRRATFRVTHTERINPRLESQVVETRYRELAPLVAVPDSIVSTMTIRQPWQRGVRRIVEQDRLITVWDVTGVTADSSGGKAVADLLDSASTDTPSAQSTRDVHGRLIAADSAPLVGAHVEILGLHMAAVAGDSGQFDLHDVPISEQTLFIRRIGYRPTTATLPATTRLVTVRLPASSVVTLDPVVVQAQRTAAAYQRIGFDVRRRTNRAFFLDATQIARMGASRLHELVARAPGFRYVQSGPVRDDGFGLAIPDGSIQTEGDPACLHSGCTVCLSYVADGQLLIDGSSIHPSLTLRELEVQFPPEKIAALEVYQASAAPPAVAALGSYDCATIVIWTKRYLGVE
jgi:hypothetical protein